MRSRLRCINSKVEICEGAEYDRLRNIQSWTDSTGVSGEVDRDEKTKNGDHGERHLRPEGNGPFHYSPLPRCGNKGPRNRAHS